MFRSRIDLPDFLKINYRYLFVRKYRISKLFVAYQDSIGNRQLLTCQSTLHYRCLKYDFHRLSSSAYNKYMLRQKRDKCWKDFKKLNEKVVNEKYDPQVEPIIVYYSLRKRKLIVLDGFHRLVIMRHQGLKHVDVAMTVRRLSSIGPTSSLREIFIRLMGKS